MGLQAFPGAERRTTATPGFPDRRRWTTATAIVGISVSAAIAVPTAAGPVAPSGESRARPATHEPTAVVALLRAEAGRYPHDRGLRDLVGELCTVSDEFRTRWAAHNVRIHHGGVKRFRHPDAGFLELTYQPLDLPVSAHEAHSMTFYTAEPGTAYEDRLKLLASWAASGPEAVRPVDGVDL
ncbi:MmyB family transcriptional regulator [Streptomyces tibetensis]|uniref:MmyB family transcriptional regulator n=1 Tax=Streptomyces tibetensis TaxID=2382123 RepID=UPI0033F5D6AD